MARTRAYHQFVLALKMSGELIRAEREHTQDPPRENEQILVMGLRGGASVMMVAAFETFLDDMLEERITEIVNFKPPISFDRLPDEVRLYNVFNSLERAMEGPKYGSKGAKELRLPAIITTTRSIANGDLIPSAFSGVSGNPSKEKIRKIFKYIGVKSIFNLCRKRFEKKWGQPIAQTFIEDKLNEIVNRRHNVAHRADVLNASRQDIESAYRFLHVFAEVIDIEVGYYIRRICKEARNNN